MKTPIEAAFEKLEYIGGVMLILSRKVGESIHVGDAVTVTVLGVARGQVKIGIDAPRELAVHREEIYRRIQDEKSRGEPTKVASNEIRQQLIR